MILSFPFQSFLNLTWRDGRPIAGDVAQIVKRNEQAVMSDSVGQALWSRVLPFIIQKATIHAAGRPRRFLSLLLSMIAHLLRKWARP